MYPPTFIPNSFAQFSLSLSSLFTPYPSLNVLIYALTFSLERVFLGLNDVVTMVLRRNLFFPNAEAKFGGDLVRQSTVAVGVRGALVFLLGWKVLLSLYIAEVRLDEERSDGLATPPQAAKSARARSSVKYKTPP